MLIMLILCNTRTFENNINMPEIIFFVVAERQASNFDDKLGTTYVGQASDTTGCKVCQSVNNIW